MSLKLNSSGGGSVTLQEPVTASTLTLTLPAFSGTAATLASVTNNGVLFVNGSGQPTSGSALTFDGTNFATTGSVTSAGLSDSGNLTFTGTGNRITGDFSNATIASRVAFQTSTTNSNTTVHALPNGTATISAFRAFNNSDPTNAAYAMLYADSTTTRLDSTITGTGTYLPMTFFTSGSERVRVDTVGNVGIGTSSPGYKLEVVSANSIVASTGSSGYGSFYARGSGTNSAYLFLGNGGGEKGRITSNDDGALTFSNGTSAIERARIDSSGNLLVGTTVFSTNAVGIRFANSATVPQISVGVSAASNNYLLYNTTAAAFRFFVSDAGQINATSTSIAAISDASLKENVRDLDTGLTQVMALKPRRFDWKEDTKIGLKNVAGFIAQEVEQILPDLVYDYQYNADETKKSLKMGDILPTLVKAIQELKAELDTVKAELAAMKGTA